MPLSFKEMQNLGIIDELARLYDNEGDALRLLQRVDFPTDRRPPFTKPASFWSAVCQSIKNGILPPESGFDRLVDEARSEWKGNAVLNQELETLNIEGPDGTRWESGNVPLDTSIMDIMRQVVREYDARVPESQRGQARAWVADLLQPDQDSFERLDPNSTVRDHVQENRLQSGDTLHVAPEATAGPVHPTLQKQAIVRVKNQILAFERRHSTFFVKPNNPERPTEYELEFRANGFGPPPAAGSAPVPITKHRVLLQLMYEHSDFPRTPPRAYWQSAVFHPNISPEKRARLPGEVERRLSTRHGLRRVVPDAHRHGPLSQLRPP